MRHTSQSSLRYGDAIRSRQTEAETRIGVRLATDEGVSSNSGKGQRVRDVGDLPLLLSVRVMASTGAGAESMIRKLCRTGVLPATKVGTDWRVWRDDFLGCFGYRDQRQARPRQSRAPLSPSPCAVHP